MPSPTRTKAMIATELAALEGVTELARAMAGRRLFVDNAHADAADTADNGSVDAPYATLAYAVSQSTNGDTIFVYGTQTIETTVIVAASISIVGIGRPEITVTGAIDGLDLATDFVRVSGLYFNGGNDAITAHINISGNNCIVEDCEFDCSDQSLFSITIAEGGHNAVIRDNVWHVTANGPDAAIHIEHASADGVIIENNVGFGMSTTNAWDLGFIYSTVVHTQCIVRNNTNHFGPGCVFTAAATGLIANNTFYGVGVTVAGLIDPGSCQLSGNRVGAAIDLPLEEFPPRISVGQRVVKSITAANGEVTIANVAGGEVLVRAIYGKVTTVIGSTVSSLKLVANPTATGSTLDLCAAVAVTSDPVGTLYSITGTVGDNLDVDKVGAVATLAKPFVVATGAIAANFSADPVGGVIEWTIIYEPLTPGATVVAA